MRETSYKAKLAVTFGITVNGHMRDMIEETVGEIPIMLKSKRCNLRGMSQKEMVNHFEDSNEFGGYFIVNGKERIIRLLTGQRRNYPLALTRKSWKGAGDLFSEYGVSIRCVRSDQLGAVSISDKLSHFIECNICFFP